MKIGVLTGGGDCPGLNAVIRGVVKSAHREGIEIIGIYDGFKRTDGETLSNADSPRCPGEFCPKAVPF